MLLFYAEKNVWVKDISSSLRRICYLTRQTIAIIIRASKKRCSLCGGAGTAQMIMEDKRMKKLYQKRKALRCMNWLAVLAMCAVFLASGITGLAARTGKITTDGARVREDADAEARKICSLPVDTTVDITDEKESGGKTWYQVKFTFEGKETTGWIRSDLLSVTETEDPGEAEPPAESEEPQEEEPSAPAAFTIQEPPEAYAGAEYLTETYVEADGQNFTAYQSDESEGLYLVWASGADGEAGWYWYDPAEGTFQLDQGQFSSQGLIKALQKEMATLKESSAKRLSQRLYIIFGLGALSLILLTVVIVLAMKLRNAEYEDFDDEDEEDEEDDYEEKKPAGRKLFSRRREDDEDEEADDFDDFLAAVKEKRLEDEDDGSADFSMSEEEEKPDLSLTANLPEIDMSAIEDVEEETAPMQPEDTEDVEDGDEDDDGFDIEILDFDDLNL